MKIKIFNNATGLQQGEMHIPASEQSTFDISSHATASVTLVETEENNYEILVDGDRYVLDLSNEPTVTETQYAQITGYEAKSGGGYQATWVVETIPTPDPAPEEPA